MTTPSKALQMLLGEEDTTAPNRSVAELRAERLETQREFVKVTPAYRALLTFARDAHTAIQPFQEQLRELQAHRDDFTGAAYARREAEIVDQRAAALAKLTEAWVTTAEKARGFAMTHRCDFLRSQVPRFIVMF